MSNEYNDPDVLQQEKEEKASQERNREEARKVRDLMRSGKLPRNKDNHDFVTRNGYDL